MLNIVRYKPLLRSQVLFKPQVFRFGVAAYSNTLLNHKYCTQNRHQTVSLINSKRLLNQFSSPPNNNRNPNEPLNGNSSNENGKKSTVLRNVVMIVILGLTALIVIQPYNPFPSPVAK